jgi:ABC-type polysaccharide/polyol phosphate transport system ATPase subunit
VLASHSVSLLKKTCTRGILLQKGEVLLDGPIEEVCEFYQNQ